MAENVGMTTVTSGELEGRKVENDSLRRIGETYYEVAVRYFRVMAGVSDYMGRFAVDTIIERAMRRYSQRSESLFSPVELALGIRPYIEKPLTAFNITLKRRHVNCRVAQDFLRHVLYGSPLYGAPLRTYLEDGQVVPDSNVDPEAIRDKPQVVLKMIKALRIELVKDISCSRLTKIPATQVFALPFELAGPLHAVELYQVIEPVVDGLCLGVSHTDIINAYEEWRRVNLPLLLRRGYEKARDLDHKLITLDRTCLEFAIMATPTGNVDFDRLLDADKMIMTDHSGRLSEAKKLLDALVMQAIALTPDLKMSPLPEE